MENKKVDMHIHTNLSNGSENLEYVLMDAQKNELEVISITDFNTLQAYFNMNNIDVKKLYKGQIVVGTEVNCKFSHYCSDMLAYNIKNMERLQDWLNRNTGKDNTKEAQMEQLEYYKKVAREINARFDEDISVSEEQPFAGKVMGSNLGLYSENIDKVKGIENPSNFFVEHCANINSPFYFDLSRYRPKLKDFIEIVHECGGLVFVAHPFAYAHSQTELSKYLEICRDEGVDGIECYQCYNEDIMYATEIPIKFCKENGLYMTGGTDFHKKEGDARYSGVGILGSDTVKNYSSYIPKSIVEPWIEPIKLVGMEVEDDDRSK